MLEPLLCLANLQNSYFLFLAILSILTKQKHQISNLHVIIQLKYHKKNLPCKQYTGAPEPSWQLTCGQFVSSAWPAFPGSSSETEFSGVHEP